MAGDLSLALAEAVEAARQCFVQLQTGMTTFRAKRSARIASFGALGPEGWHGEDDALALAERAARDFEDAVTNLTTTMGVEAVSFPALNEPAQILWAARHAAEAFKSALAVGDDGIWTAYDSLSEAWASALGSLANVLEVDPPA